jgi:hypothetical protein
VEGLAGRQALMRATAQLAPQARGLYPAT